MVSKLFVSERVYAKLVQLYGESDARREVIALIRRKCSIFFSTLAITVAIVCTYYVLEGRDYREHIKAIERNNPGEGDRQVRINAYYQGYEENILLNISEKKYTLEETEAFAVAFEDMLPELIRGENCSLDSVTTDLILSSKYEGYPFDITWKVDKPLLINYKGVLDKQAIRNAITDNNTGIPISLCAQAIYEDFSRDMYLSILLFDTAEEKEDMVKRRLTEELEEADNESKTMDARVLPEIIDGAAVLYGYSDKNKEIIIVLAGIIVAIGLVFSKDREIDKKLNDRNNQLEKDYAGILNQYVLYYYAGLSHRHIWSKICDKYRKRLEQGEEKRYAYEEMLVTEKGIKEGVGEISAYENFANRCQCVKYRVFTSIIEQSLRSGGDRLDIILREEVEKARREYINRVKKDAQELSTKMLVPMMIMLIIVLIVVMIPAFISFNN